MARTVPTTKGDHKGGGGLHDGQYGLPFLLVTLHGGGEGYFFAAQRPRPTTCTPHNLGMEIHNCFWNLTIEGLSKALVSRTG